MDFVQSGPRLRNQYDDDATLRAWLARRLPATVLAAIEPDLRELGALAAEAWDEARARGPAEPRLVQWDAWGARIDRVETTPVWQRGAALATRYGLLAAGHETRFGAHARVDQFARVYLHHVASEFHTCPLAMSDGAATALKAAGAGALAERSLPRLLSRDPSTLWLSGQWMTETAGGSDVARTDTVARRDADGGWRLYGRKWFASAVVGEMALTLARPEGAAGGTDALALFHVETRDADGHWNGIRIDRLKDKLGTRELPTAEIHLDGTLATPVGEPAHGVRLIAPMLNVTRTWNAVCALATMRRCLALAGDSAARRDAFGRRLLDQPLHRATLARLWADFEGAFRLVFYVAQLLGRTEQGDPSPDDRRLLRVLTPLAKLWTGRLAVAIASETCEAFGGAGYIENTGIPQLLRDAQVFPIWEGTTNVLALDVLRALGGDDLGTVARCVDAMCGDEARRDLRDGIATLHAWHRANAASRDALEAGARDFAIGLARCVATTLLAVDAHDSDPRAASALAPFRAAGFAPPPAPMDAAALLADNGAP